jgi:hypothetical protein
MTHRQRQLMVGSPEEAIANLRARMTDRPERLTPTLAERLANDLLEGEGDGLREVELAEHLIERGWTLAARATPDALPMDSESVTDRLARAMHDARGAYGAFGEGDCRCREDAEAWLDDPAERAARTTPDALREAARAVSDKARVVVDHGRPTRPRWVVEDAEFSALRQALAATPPAEPEA